MPTVLARWAPLLLLLTLNACGEANPGSAASVATQAPTVTQDGVELVANAVRVTQRHVRLELEPSASSVPCGQRAHAEVVEDGPDRVYVQARADSTGHQACSPFRPVLVLDVRLGDRELVVSGESWTRADGDDLRRCGVVGCDPPRDRCDQAWTSTVVQDVELPPEQQVDVMACAEPWLVAEVSATVTGCQSVDGSTPPGGCIVDRLRWFGHLEDDVWRVVASGPSAGCVDVRPGRPDFPRPLCRGLDVLR